jgi:hypothetical protein
MSRNTETRAATARPKRWQPASKLDAPPPKDGQHFRWIRESTLGRDDPANLAGRLREGYEIVHAKEYPEFSGPVATDGTFRNGGLVLCRTDVDIAKDRARQMERMAIHQLDSVNANLEAEEHPKMATLYRRSSSDVSYGKRPEPTDNDEGGSNATFD